ncbi:MAG: response regulator, partial [Desulfomonilaceae bacterium]
HLGSKPGRYVLLSVSDTGHGIDKDTLLHIFVPFFTTKEVGKGTGLGLATVYGIVKQHDGYIICYSEPGYGTTFKIFLPAICSHSDSEQQEPERPLTGGNETILLVDDDNSVRDWGSRILSHWGYKILTAVNGNEALDIFRQQKDRIPLIILDLIMPEMDGSQCLREILKTDPKSKVVLVSGYPVNWEEDNPITRGARGFVHKPFDTRKLLTTVRTILDADQ